MQFDVVAPRAGTVQEINCRLLSKVAKLAGAPVAKAAGLECPVKIGDKVKKGDLLYRIHVESTGELEYVKGFLKSQQSIVVIK